MTDRETARNLLPSQAQNQVSHLHLNTSVKLVSSFIFPQLRYRTWVLTQLVPMPARFHSMPG